jgi:hypothetical protein
MDAASRRKIEMGTRALEFSRAYPDSDAGYTAAAVKQEQLVARAGALATAQRNGGRARRVRPRPRREGHRLPGRPAA